MIRGLAGQVRVRYGGNAAFNVSRYNTTFYVAEPGATRSDVAFWDCQGKGHVPGQLYDPKRGAHFKAVPIPTDALAANGTDAELTGVGPEHRSAVGVLEGQADSVGLAGVLGRQDRPGLYQSWLLPGRDGRDGNRPA